MRFKVGDKVRIREDLEFGSVYGNVFMLESMCKQRGTISEILDLYLGNYLLKDDAVQFIWSEGMLELVEESSGSSDEQPDVINKPPHYNKFSFQPIDIINEVTNYYEGSTAFYIGTVLKYLCRAPFKGKLLEDLKKANYYLTRAISDMESDSE